MLIKGCKHCVLRTSGLGMAFPIRLDVSKVIQSAKSAWSI